MNRTAMGLSLFAAVGLLTTGCATASAPDGNPQTATSAATRPAAMPTRGVRAIAVIHPASGSHVHGIVRFVPATGGGLRITADIEGLAPDSTHGFHIHEYGDCSANNASSAGGHYNPGHQHHAGPSAPHHHAGDLGNIHATAKGNAHVTMIVKDITVDGAENPVLGRAVIVHEKADDLKSQPSGDAGARIGCGVIGLAKP